MGECQILLVCSPSQVIENRYCHGLEISICFELVHKVSIQGTSFLSIKAAIRSLLDHLHHAHFYESEPKHIPSKCKA